MNFPKPTKKRYIRLGFFLFVVGLSGLFLPFYSNGFFSDPAFLGEVAQDQTANISDLYVAATPSSSLSSVDIGTPSPTPDPNAPKIQDRLVIEKAGINLALIQSQSSGALWKGGWVFPNTSTPDKGGNTVIFGHRFRYLPPISNTLYSLDKVNIGDKFSVTWRGINYQYVVSGRNVIDPTDLSVLNPTSDSRITIVTCFPLFSSKQRLVIVGELIK